ncbi:MAG: hypothetical protein L6Q57_00340 [Alphaproteobacteria bacterium]|nr:hypothetical protein [Alphaproteobacteria bacterium]
MAVDYVFDAYGSAPQGGIYSANNYQDFSFGDSLQLHLLTHPTGTDTVEDPNITIIEGGVGSAIYGGYIKAGDLCFTVDSGKLSIRNIVDPNSSSTDLVRFDFTMSNITDISGNTLPESAFGPIAVIFAGPASTINNASVASAFNALGAGKFNDSGNRIVFQGSNPNSSAEGRFSEFSLLGKSNGGDMDGVTNGTNGVKNAENHTTGIIGAEGGDIIPIPGGPVPAPGATVLLGFAACVAALSRKRKAAPEAVMQEVDRPAPVLGH